MATLVPASASMGAEPACTVWGTPGSDQWTVTRGPVGPGEISPDAVVCGGSGNDRLRTPGPPFRGTFLGAAGRDSIGVMAGHGTFLGGRGRDRVAVLRGGIFKGGPGADGVSAIEGGRFVGGPGADRTSIMVVGLASADLALRASVVSERVLLGSVVFVAWADTSLGCPEEGSFYAQVITPGYRVRLAAGGVTHVYHTDTGTQVRPVSGTACQDQVAA